MKKKQIRTSLVALILSLLSALSSPDVFSATKIMLLGDSITELNWEGGYRPFLYKKLHDAGYVFDFVGTKTSNHDDSSLGFDFPQAYWNHEGYNSATIDIPGSVWRWSAKLRGKLTANPPDVILILLGVNDITNGSRSTTQIRNTMSAFLDSIWGFNPDIKVVLGSLTRMFPGGSLYNATAAQNIQEFNALLPAMVAAKVQTGRYCVLVDNYSALTVSSDFEDGVHPSVTGYPKIANAWYPAVAVAIGVTDVRSVTVGVPTSFALDQNYPNPFNPLTTIRYSLPRRSSVSLTVYDPLGQNIATLVQEDQNAGTHEVRFEGNGLASGVYFYRLTTGEYAETKRLVLMK